MWKRNVVERLSIPADESEIRDIHLAVCGYKSGLDAVIRRQAEWIQRTAKDEDLAQTVFAELLKQGLTDFRGRTPAELRAWLKQIIRNQRARSGRRRSGEPERFNGLDDVDKQASSGGRDARWHISGTKGLHHLDPRDPQGSTAAWFTVRCGRKGVRWGLDRPRLASAHEVLVRCETIKAASVRAYKKLVRFGGWGKP